MTNPLLPFIDAETEAQGLIDMYPAAAIVEWVGRYEFLVAQLETYQREGHPGDVSALIVHVRGVLELLRQRCQAGQRI